MNTLQERYSKMVMAKLRDSIVIKDGYVCNNDYEGDPTAGAVKVPVRDTEVIVTDYDKANGIKGTNSVTGYETIVIDKDKAVNEIIDGYDSKSVPDGIIAERLDSAGYSLARQMDIDASEKIVEGSLMLSDDVTKTNIYDFLVNLRTTLTTNGVPNDDRRFLLVTPTAESMILKCDEFMSASELGDNLKVQGAIGKILGFNVFAGWMPNVPGVLMVGGHPKFFTRVREFSVPIKVQDINGSGNFIGASAVQGRMCYAHKVLRNKAIIKCGSSINDGSPYVTTEVEMGTSIKFTKNYDNCKVYYKQGSSEGTIFAQYGWNISNSISSLGLTEITTKDKTLLESSGKYIALVITTNDGICITNNKYVI